MSIAETKNLLQDLIEHSDERLVHILYQFAVAYNNENKTNEQVLLAELEQRRQRHLDGISKSYTWQEVKGKVQNGL